MEKHFSFGKAGVRLLLVLYSVVVIVPFAMLFLTSTKMNTEFYANIWALPESPIASIVNNYAKAIKEGNIAGSFINTVFICTMALALSLILSAMVSYTLARRHLKSEPALTFLYLIGLLIPELVGLTPMLLMARFIGLMDTRLILIISYGTCTIPFCVFVMTAFFKTIPTELEEAASIDGANLWQCFGRIIVPLVRPAFVTAGIFCFLDYWSDYMRPLLFITSDAKKTISMGMLKFKVVSGFKIDWGVTTAACVLFILPVLILYACFQRQLMGGLTTGSVKG
jgi:ABC-type glycerol-3-phosphate transport system permease component